ncbi:MAG: hypothetical protein A2Z01_07260 [Betaproteobacteria bacterium RBG_16_58_11]|nr:MAG: hypothetical protein A2Z01_07260 [Betaproteobacteria bacterium RBG_16_58_11]OFZ96911.1 MAG: hypothetical protein A2Z44_00905 [Betaproteobacteria bacterium RBG_19FT_COMBO_58_11]
MNLDKVSHPVGMLKMTGEAGIDAKIIAVPVDKLCTLYQGMQKPEDFPAMMRNHLQEIASGES